MRGTTSCFRLCVLFFVHVALMLLSTYALSALLVGDVWRFRSPLFSFGKRTKQCIHTPPDIKAGEKTK